jgi:hypothetical protein
MSSLVSVSEALDRARPRAGAAAAGRVDASEEEGCVRDIEVI